MFKKNKIKIKWSYSNRKLRIIQPKIIELLALRSTLLSKHLRRFTLLLMFHKRLALRTSTTISHLKRIQKKPSLSLLNVALPQVGAQLILLCLRKPKVSRVFRELSLLQCLVAKATDLHRSHQADKECRLHLEFKWLPIGKMCLNNTPHKL